MAFVFAKRFAEDVEHRMQGFYQSLSEKEASLVELSTKLTKAGEDLSSLQVQHDSLIKTKIELEKDYIYLIPKNENPSKSHHLNNAQLADMM